MPVLRRLGPAPETEPRDPRDVHEVLAQGPVIRNHQRDARIRRHRLREPRLEAAHERGAPGVARRVRVRMQQELVRGHGIRLLGPAQCVRAADVGGAEAVVVQREYRRYDGGPALAVPAHERVLGRVHAVPARDVHAVLVLGLAAQVRPRRLQRVQLVVARAPKHRLEIARRGRERELQVFGGLADVAAQDEAVLEVRFELLECFAVVLVAEVEISDGVELHNGAVASIARVGLG